MQKPVTTIKAYGTFLAVGGLGFVLFPNRVPALVGLPATQAVWVQLLGLTTMLLSIYYWSSALANARHFFITSVYGRFFFSAGCVGLVVLASAPLPVAAFALVSCGTAVWTRVALQREDVAHQTAQAEV